MSDNRRIAKNSLILYLQLLITAIVGLFSSRIVLQNLGASDFGLYNVVGGIVVMINLLNTAMTSTTYRFIAFEMGKGNISSVNKVFNISLMIHACLAFMVVLFAETLGSFYVYHYLNAPADRISDAMFVFRFSYFGVVFSIISIPFKGLVTAQEKFFLQAFIEITHILLRLAAAALLIYGVNRLRMYAVLTMIALAVTSIMYIVYCRRKYLSIVSWQFHKDKSKYREMIGFSSWIMLGAMGTIGKVHGSALVINFFFGTILNAAYGIANQVNHFILLFSQNLGVAVIPQITKNYSGGNLGRTMQLVFYMPKYSFFLMLLPTLPILLETEYLLDLWLDIVPEYTSLFCQLMIVGALIECLNSGVQAAVEATGKIKYFHIFRSVISLSSLPVAIILFKFNYPPQTILVIYIVTTFVRVIAEQLVLKGLIEFDVKEYFRISYLRILYVVICISPLFLIKNIFTQGASRFFSVLFASLVWLALVVYIVGIEKGERMKLKLGIIHLSSKVIRKNPLG